MVAKVTWLFIMTLQFIDLISSQEVVKRVPQGFLGVRGKKYYEQDELDHYYKRVPQFFVGGKGRKTLLDYLKSSYDKYYKRAPMGFVGMRGKKDFSDMSDPDHFDNSYQYLPPQGSMIGQIDYSPDEAIAQESDFSLLNRLINEYQKQNDAASIESNDVKLGDDTNNLTAIDYSNEDHSTNMITKRAAQARPFFGVRGKKGTEVKRPFDMYFRGKFVGVRGKKDLRNSGVKNMHFLLNREEPWPKRKGQMNGFFGMRGKKWVDDSGSEEEIRN